MNDGKSIDAIIPTAFLHYTKSANNIYDSDNVNVYINNVNNNMIINTKNKKAKKNKNIIKSATYYHFPQSLPNIKKGLFLYNSNSTTPVQSATIINPNSYSNMGLLMHKSNSYNDGSMIKAKTTIIKQNEYDGRFNTTIHNNDDGSDDENKDYGVTTMTKTSISMPAFCTHQLSMVNNYNNSVAITADDHAAFLNYQETHATTNAINSAIAETIASTTTTTATTASATATPTATIAAAAATTKATTITLFNINNRRYNRSHRNNHNNRDNNKSQRYAICYRLHNIIAQYNLYLNYLVPCFLLIGLMFIAYLTRDYAKRLLYWIELQNHWIIFIMFMIFFTIVSFPIVVGYFVLMITAGYLFGFTKGLITVILGANLGIFIAHLTLRKIRHRIPIQKIIKNETGRAILRVISGPRAFRVVLFTRLTPIPFGLQNTIFGISSINTRLYHIATFLGLLPAQIINVYLGSTLRSMHEVLNNQGTALTGYISFAIEVICGIALMCWVVRKARKELSNTLLTNLNNENRLIDIQV